MLQSVLDPFDAYGAPSEDQIFSILPPLSIMASSQSPSTQHSASLASTPSHTSLHEAFVTSGGSAPTAAPAWLNAQTTVQYASEPAMEWADAKSPSTSPPLPPSPPSPSPSSPSASSLTRRSHHSHKPSSPRAESKLRSVLSVIDESNKQVVSDTATRVAENDDDVGITGDFGKGSAWTAFPFGGSEDKTPRNSQALPDEEADEHSPGLRLQTTTAMPMS
jgi:hypothetical protein